MIRDFYDRTYSGLMTASRKLQTLRRTVGDRKDEVEFNVKVHNHLLIASVELQKAQKLLRDRKERIRPRLMRRNTDE